MCVRWWPLVESVEAVPGIGGSIFLWRDTIEKCPYIESDSKFPEGSPYSTRSVQVSVSRAFQMFSTFPLVENPSKIGNFFRDHFVY